VGGKLKILKVLVPQKLLKALRDLNLEANNCFLSQNFSIIKGVGLVETINLLDYTLASKLQHKLRERSRNASLKKWNPSKIFLLKKII
jgi:hypothetical protein